ncbi:MAG: Ig-like domain-containing protein [Bdellovibrionales bacterium]|nr:Ig-like domain-containing protein [Bdellovibrionales bacterium]
MGISRVFSKTYAAFAVAMPIALTGCFRAGLVWDGGDSIFSPGPFNVSMPYNTWPADFCQDVTLTSSSGAYLPEQISFAASSGTVEVFAGSGCSGPSAIALGAVHGIGASIPSANFSIRQNTAGTHTLTVQAVAADLVTITGQTQQTFTSNASSTSPSVSSVAVSGSATANLQSYLSVTVTLKDAYGNLASGRNVSLSSSRSGNDVISPSSATSDASGLATFQVRTNSPGTSTFTAIDTSSVVVLSSTPTGTFSAQVTSPAQSSAVLSSGGSWISGGPETITVTLRDSSGVQRVSGGESAALNVVNGGSGNFSFSGPTDNLDGTYTFSVTPTVVGSPSITVNYISGGPIPISGMPLAAAIAHGAPDHLALDSPAPAGCKGGEVCSTPLKIMLQDAAGNPCNTASGFITVGASGATITQGSTEPLSSGVSIFSNLIINEAGTFTVSAVWSADAAKPLIGPPTITVAVGAAYQLVFSTSPGGSILGGTQFGIQPTVSVKDRGGNTVTASAASVLMTIDSGTVGAILSGTTTRIAVSGNAAFTDLSIDKIGGSYKLRATSAGLLDAVSAGFSVLEGPYHHVTWVAQPLNTVSMSSILASGGLPMKVEARDAGDNLVTAENGSGTLTIWANPSSGIMTGPGSFTFSSGVASLSGFSIDKAGVGYQLSVIKDSVAYPSTAFDIQVGPPVASNSIFALINANFDGQLNANEVGMPTPSPTLRATLRDSGGNYVTTANPANLTLNQPAYVAGESYMNAPTFSHVGGGVYEALLSGQYAGRPVQASVQWLGVDLPSSGTKYFVKTPTFPAFASTIEMVDHPLSAPLWAVHTFNRTKTPFDLTGFDGTMTCKFEAVIENVNMTTGSGTVYYATAGGSSLVGANFSYPDGTTGPKRIESSMLPCSNFTGDPGNFYIVKADTSSAGGAGYELKIYSARLRVFQYNPTKTRLYIPLAGYRHTSTGGDLAAIMTTTETAYAQPGNDFYEGQVLWKKNFNEYGTVVGAKFFGIVKGGVGASAKLALTSGGSPVTSDGITPIELTSSLANTLDFVQAPLPMNNSYFVDGNTYKAQIRSSSAVLAASLFRAGIILDLKNLTQADTYTRIGMAQSVTTSVMPGTVYNSYQRIAAPFAANPNLSFHLETTGYYLGSGSTTINSMYCGSNDEGLSCSALTPGISFSSGSVATVRSAAIDFSSVSLGDRIIVQYQIPASSTWNNQATFLVGKIWKYQ